MILRPLHRYATGILAAAMYLAAGQALAQDSSASSAAPAEEPDTLILSDTLHYDDVKRQSVFTGNVIMTRGLLKLTSDQLTMREDADGFQFGTATADKGKLVHVRQENPEKYEVIEAQGLRAEYDGKNEELEMIGQAIITRYVCGKPFDNIKGERVIYHQKTDTYEAFSGPQSAASGGRVRSLAHPRAKVDAALAECQKKSASTQ
ncbi:lipopolysaccharide transport periplasmic protein LptA [Allopusillimonas ginsengisoli]|uniref:lipopolysaccharide transport periplasmic protein LptA n=1 Tax=Allopusillimonas ginsengisoli TaxID=453575 RepID=UPI00101F4E54|nr:lipopolysaccharide transport periplasmic protein LptA [Allopusillimonas ginsengisoli]